MILSNTRATVGLQTKAAFTSTAISGSPQIGANPKTIAFPDADVAYSLRAFFAAGTPSLVLNPTTGATTGSTAWVAGTAQIETATAAGTATASGDVTVTVTSAGMTGSPLAIAVPIVNGDLPATWAGKVRTALAANATISGRFTVSGTSTSIILTRKPGTVLNDGTEVVNLFVATDSTLNIAIAAGSTGITAASTSANTNAGTVTSGVLIRDGDGKDFEGVTIPTCSPNAMLFDNSGTGLLGAETVGGISYFIEPSGTVLFASTGDLEDKTAITISPSVSGPTILTITVVGTAD
jgi:hypothetical protein